MTSAIARRRLLWVTMSIVVVVALFAFQFWINSRPRPIADFNGSIEKLTAALRDFPHKTFDPSSPSVSTSRAVFGICALGADVEQRLNGAALFIRLHAAPEGEKVQALLKSDFIARTGPLMQEVDRIKLDLRAGAVGMNSIYGGARLNKDGELHFVCEARSFNPERLARADVDRMLNTAARPRHE